MIGQLVVGRRDFFEKRTIALPRCCSSECVWPSRSLTSQVGAGWPMSSAKRCASRIWDGAKLSCFSRAPSRTATASGIATLARALARIVRAPRHHRLGIAAGILSPASEFVIGLLSGKKNRAEKGGHSTFFEK